MDVDTCLSCGTECTMDDRCPCCSAKRKPNFCTCLEGPALQEYGRKLLMEKNNLTLPVCDRCSLYVGEVRLDV